MCGICGFVARDPTMPIDTAMIRRMTETLVHRGPDSDGLLPRAITTRRKVGLIGPTAEWMRRGVWKVAGDLLGDRALADSGLFDVDAVRTVIRRHRAGQTNHGREIGGILAVQLWQRYFEMEMS